MEKNIKKKPLVSVIVLTYNHRNYISQALDSILCQKTDFSYEILVGDDASTDGTSEIVNAYSNNYPNLIRAFIRKKNLGTSRNLCKLLQETCGEYIASCEGDDFWTDDKKLQKQIDFLRNNPCYIGCTHPVNVVDYTGNIMDEKVGWVICKKEFSFADFDGFNLPGHALSMVYKNIFLKEVDPSVLPSLNEKIADRSVVAMLVSKGIIFQLDEYMASYRYVRNVGGSGATNRLCDSINHFKDEYQYTKRLEKYLTNTEGKEVIFPSMRRHMIMESIRDVLYRRRVLSAIYIPGMIIDYFMWEVGRHWTKLLRKK